MLDLFFLLSGEHTSLPFSEVVAVLEAEELTFFNLKVLPQILLLKGDPKCIDTASRRCGFLRNCGLVIFNCEGRKEKILKQAKETAFEKFIGGNETFSVRVRKIHGATCEVNSKDLEGDLGKIILEKVKGIKVDLVKPNKVFMGFLVRRSFIFGLSLYEAPRGAFAGRRPSKRPFFHPTAISPKLARCMVNLARPKTGEIVLDPFCGTGSTLIEAGLIGCQVIGADIDSKMIKGSLMNLHHFGITPIGMIVGDARKLAVKGISHVVADPPYGRSASTYGAKAKELIVDFLSLSLENLDKDGFLCIASPKGMMVDHVGSDLGFIVVERHYVYMNKNLTRQIVVLRKP